MKKIKYNDNTNKDGVEGWFNVNGPILTVYAEGSNSLGDWIANFLPFFTTTVNGKKAHLFYARRARWLANFVYLLAEKHRISHIKLYGHSKGGTEAEIAREFLTQKGNGYVMSVETYGAPKGIVNPTQPVKRWRRRGDIVPLLPPGYHKEHIEVFGALLLFWKAHEPRSYYQKMIQSGIR